MVNCVLRVVRAGCERAIHSLPLSLSRSLTLFLFIRFVYPLAFPWPLLFLFIPRLLHRCNLFLSFFLLFSLIFFFLRLCFSIGEPDMVHVWYLQARRQCGQRTFRRDTRFNSNQRRFFLLLSKRLQRVVIDTGVGVVSG